MTGFHETSGDVDEDWRDQVRHVSPRFADKLNSSRRRNDLAGTAADIKKNKRIMGNSTRLHGNAECSHQPRQAWPDWHAAGAPQPVDLVAEMNLVDDVRRRAT